MSWMGLKFRTDIIIKKIASCVEIIRGWLLPQVHELEWQAYALYRCEALRTLTAFTQL